MVETLSPPPSWAVSRYRGILVPGTQLNTHDGRVIGNAVVIEVEEAASLFTGWMNVTIVTDFGNKEEFTVEYIESLFHEPEWVMDLSTHTGYKAWQEGVRNGTD